MAQSESKGFGAEIRHARQAVGVELRDLSQTTRIQLRYLEALEAEDWSVVPRGVIGRGFVRVLARELRLPVDALLQRYCAARGDDDAEPARSLPEAEWKVDLRASSRGRSAAWVAAGLVVVALAAWQFGTWQRGAPEAPSEPATVVVAPAAELAPPTARPGEVAELSPKPPLKQLERPSAPPQAPSAPARPGPTARPAEGAPSTGGRLEVEASQRVWVRVTPAGAAPQERVLKPGERVAYQTPGEAELKVGNAGAVKLYWNGALLGTAGKGSQVVTLTLPRDLPPAPP